MAAIDSQGFSGGGTGPFSVPPRASLQEGSPLIDLELEVVKSIANCFLCLGFFGDTIRQIQAASSLASSLFG